jgi:hypothetical protein
LIAGIANLRSLLKINLFPTLRLFQHELNSQALKRPGFAAALREHPHTPVRLRGSGILTSRRSQS